MRVTFFSASIIFFFQFIVSCNSTSENEHRSAILTAESLQFALNSALFDGNHSLNDLKSEISTNIKSEQTTKKNKLLLIFEQMKKIDSISLLSISTLESTKQRLLVQSGKNINNKHEYPSFNIDFSNLKNLNETTKTTKVINKLTIDSLWHCILNLRSQLSFMVQEDIFSENATKRMKDIQINTFNSKHELSKNYIEKLKEQGISDEDHAIMTEIYSALSFLEYNQGSNEFYDLLENCSLINAFNNLMSIELRILNARSLALNHWASKISYCSSGFDKIIPIIDGPSSGKSGDTLLFNAFFGAVDSYNNPTIEVNELPAEIYYQEGTAYFKIVVPTNRQTINLSGVLFKKKKSGERQSAVWKHTIQVLH